VCTDINDPELTEAEELLRDQEATLADLQAEREVREASLRLKEAAALKRAAKKASTTLLSAEAPEYNPKSRADASPFSSPPVSPVKGRARSRSPNGSTSEEEPNSTNASPTKHSPDQSSPDHSSRDRRTLDKDKPPQSTPTTTKPQVPTRGILRLPFRDGLRPNTNRRVQLSLHSAQTPNSTPGGDTRKQ
jgi:hypothetical protein